MNQLISDVFKDQGKSLYYAAQILQWHHFQRAKVKKCALNHAVSISIL